MKKISCVAILLFAVLAIGCSGGGGGGGEDLFGKLTKIPYKIANQTELTTQLSALTSSGTVPQSAPAEHQIIPGGKATGARLPDTIVFSTDGTFKLTYSDGAYLQGTWKLTGGALEMVAAGRTASVDFSFPSDDSITITITSSTPTSTSPGFVGGGGTPPPDGVEQQQGGTPPSTGEPPPPSEPPIQ